MAQIKEFSVEEKLTSLIKLQKVDIKLDGIKVLKGELPIEVSDLEDEIAGLHSRQNRIEEEINGIQQFIADKYTIIKDAQELTNKYEKQSDNVKNNREFEAINKEMEMQGLEIKLAEKHIKDANIEISEKALADGFKNVVKNTGLNGRWQILQEAPKVICDTAHNKEGLHYAMSQLLKEQYEQLHMVFGVVSDKDISTILPLLPQDAIYYFCKPNIARGFNANDLRDVFRSNGFIGESYSTVLEALSAAKQQATTSDVIYIGGSTFVVGEII